MAAAVGATANEINICAASGYVAAARETLASAHEVHFVQGKPVPLRDAAVICSRNRLFAVIVVLASAAPALAADAPCGAPGRPCPPQPQQNSWVFRRSYYTHDPAIPVQIGPYTARRAPVYTRPQGEYVRGSYRNSFSVIRVNGQIWDRTWQWDSWVQTGSQR